MAAISLLTKEVLEPGPEREFFPILYLHGYEVYAKGRLGPLSQAVCDTAVRLLQMNGDLRVIVLGGWHLKEAGTWTIADAMVNCIVNAGISPKRIITKECFETLSSVMPPRDSWEEFLMLLQILGRLGISPRAPLQGVAWDFHIRRLKKMCKTFGLTNTEIVPAVPEPHEGLARRQWMERAARIVRFIDPQGGGIICHGTRLKRTLNEGLKPLIP